MNNQEFFAQALKNEFAAHRRVIAALPADALDYRPHENSRTARTIASIIAEEVNNIAGILEHGNLEATEKGSPADKDQILKHLDEGIAKVEARLSGVSDERWNSMGKFLVDGNEIAQMPTSALGWLVHNDLIHHRGQLSTYIRPMGGKVPSIYGPSGDDNGRG